MHVEIGPGGLDDLLDACSLDRARLLDRGRRLLHLAADGRELGVEVGAGGVDDLLDACGLRGAVLLDRGRCLLELGADADELAVEVDGRLLDLRADGGELEVEVGACGVDQLLDVRRLRRPLLVDGGRGLVQGGGLGDAHGVDVGAHRSGGLFELDALPR